MPPRFRSSLGIACLLVIVYFVLTHDAVNFGNPLPPVDLHSPDGTPPGTSAPEDEKVVQDTETSAAAVETPYNYWGTAGIPAAPEPTDAKEINFAPKPQPTESWDTDTTRPLQEQFSQEYEKLGG